MKRDRRNILILIATALLARLLLFSIISLHPDRAIRPDTNTYITPAVQTLQNGGHYPTLDSHRTPGFPLFIALIYSFAGQRTAPVLLVQLLLDTLSVLLTFMLGKRILGRRPAFIGALIAAISLEMVISSMLLLSETLFTFLLLSTMLTFIFALERKSRLWLISSGILLGLATLTRPISLYFPIALIAMIIFFEKTSVQHRLWNVVIFTLVFGVTLSPWVIRNVYVVGAPTISTISNYNLLFYNATALEANLGHTSEALVREDLKARLEEYMRASGMQDTELSRAIAESTLAKEIILAHPGRYLFVHLKGDLNSLLPNITDLTELLGITVGGRGTASVLNQFGIWAAVRHYFGGQIWLPLLLSPFLLLLSLVYLAALFGIVSLAARHKFFALVILLLPTLYFLLLPGAPSLPRFRVPVWPYICLLAGVGFSVSQYRIFVRIRQNRQKRINQTQQKNMETDL